MVCLVSLNASGTTFVLVDVTSGAEAGTSFNEDVGCPDDCYDVADWSRTGW